MAQLKTDKIVLKKDFCISLQDGWMRTIDIQSIPTNYTLTRGKKSINFNSDVAKSLCLQDYGIRLVKGRRQMVVPSHVLQSFVEHSVFLQWYDPCMQDVTSDDHVTSESYISCDSNSSDHSVLDHHGINSGCQN